MANTFVSHSEFKPHCIPTISEECSIIASASISIHVGSELGCQLCWDNITMCNVAASQLDWPYTDTFIFTPLLVFRKKDLYLVITQKLIFMKFGRFHEIWWISCEIWQISCEIHQISCEIKRYSLPTALHTTEEFLLSYLIYKVFRWIS